MSKIVTKGVISRSGVAFIHTGAWGDLYVSTAALKSVIDKFPGESVTIVGSDKWLKIIEANSWPSIKSILTSSNGRYGELFSWDKTSNSWTSGEKNVSLRRYFSTFKATFNIRTESLRFALAPFLARVPVRHGSAPRLWSRLFYTHRAPWLGKDPIIHERDRMLQVIEAPSQSGVLANQWTNSTGLPAIKKINRENAEKIVQAKFGRYWLINPTASRREKAWPAENFRALFEKLKPLATKNGLELRILGSPSETEWLKEALPASESFDKTVIQTKHYFDLFDVIGGCQLLIANTSSLQFLSSGYGAKTITLMGCANPKIWGPLGPGDLIIRATGKSSVKMAPEPDQYAKEREAYSRISVEQVLEGCKQFLGF